LLGAPSARVQDFYAVSVQARLCARVGETSLIRAMVSFDLLAQAPSILMQILKRIGLVLVWLAGAVFVFAAVNKKRPLSDFAAGAGKHCSGRSEHHRRRGPHPRRLLAARHRRTVAHSGVVPAIAVDARRACIVRMAQATCLAEPMPRKREASGDTSLLVLVIFRGGCSRREGPGPTRQGTAALQFKVPGFRVRS
jgi:hypothetical protein